MKNEYNNMLSSSNFPLSLNKEKNCSKTVCVCVRARACVRMRERNVYVCMYVRVCARVRVHARARVCDGLDACVYSSIQISGHCCL